MLQNLEDGKFEKLSFLTGILRGLPENPSEVSKEIRAGSIFMLSLYIWIAVFVGYYHDKEWSSVGWMIMNSAMLVSGAIALIQVVELTLFRTTVSHSIFRLSVINAKGKRANRATLLRRWAIVWLPLLVPMLLVALLIKRADLTTAFICALVLLGLWVGAAVYAVIFPNRGLHDRLAGTWVVRC